MLRQFYRVFFLSLFLTNEINEIIDKISKNTPNILLITLDLIPFAKKYAPTAVTSAGMTI